MSDMTIDHQHSSPAAHAQRADNMKFAMWLYLASEVILFTVLIAAYAVFRHQEAELVHSVHEALGLSGTLLVTFNTFLLLTSSWAMVMGLRQVQKGDSKGLVQWLSLTAVLGTVFVLLQYVEYQRLGELEVTMAYANDAFEGFGMHFYAPTAFHGAHVVIGVIWCIIVINQARKGGYSSSNYLGVEIFGLYWHFVDVVWILLFTLIYLV